MYLFDCRPAAAGRKYLRGDILKIAVCYKCVPFNESIHVKGDRTLDLDKVTWEIGKYDLNAAEAGVQIAAASGAEAVAVSANGSVLADSKLRTSILSRGLTSLFAVQDDSLSLADSLTTAKALKAVIEKVGDVELAICGEGSGDVYAQQVGNTLGALLGWNTVNGVKSYEYADGKLVCTRNISDGTETVEVTLPAVISVTADANLPRVPTMKDILGAGKKPAQVWSLEELGLTAGAAYETVSILAPEQTDRKKIMIEGASDEAIDTLVGYIKNAL